VQALDVAFQMQRPPPLRRKVALQSKKPDLR